MKLQFEQIKHPLVVLENGYHKEVWWEGDEGSISFWCDSPGDFPQYCIGHHKDKEDALDRLDELLKEGWEISEGSRENIEEISYRR